MEPRQRLNDMSLQIQQIGAVQPKFKGSYANTWSTLQRIKLRLHAVRTAFWDATYLRNKTNWKYGD